jgi:hypothetical protein
VNNSEISEARRDEILRLAQAECARAIGFDTVNSGELTAQREKALLYARGEMPDLVMELSGRSKVVDTAVADAIETALPDLMDIFTGGDDVVACGAECGVRFDHDGDADGARCRQQCGGGERGSGR